MATALPDRHGTPSQNEQVAMLDSAITMARSELTRADNKCSSLLGISGAGLAVLIVATTGNHNNLLATIDLWLSISAVTTSITIILWVLRPKTHPVANISAHGFALVPPADAPVMLRASAEEGPLVWRMNHLRSLSTLLA